MSAPTRMRVLARRTIEPILNGQIRGETYEGRHPYSIAARPIGWAYSDDIYIVYVDGGYYMYDPFHPGVRIAVSIL